jgi:hypothetical protein
MTQSILQSAGLPRINEQRGSIGHAPLFPHRHPWDLVRHLQRIAGHSATCQDDVDRLNEPIALLATIDPISRSRGNREVGLDNLPILV